MMDRLQMRWVIIGLVWMAVFLLSRWNLGLIEEIEVTRQRRVLEEKDNRFLADEAERIVGLGEKQATLVQPVEGLKLGLLKLENEMTRLALKCDLQEMIMRSLSVDSWEEGSIPVTFSFEGGIRGVVEWVDAVDRGYPYLPFKKLEIEVLPSGDHAACRAWFNYRYAQTPEPQQAAR